VVAFLLAESAKSHTHLPTAFVDYDDEIGLCEGRKNRSAINCKLFACFDFLLIYLIHLVVFVAQLFWITVFCLKREIARKNNLAFYCLKLNITLYFVLHVPFLLSVQLTFNIVIVQINVN
jgi:hypothetical protein